MSGLTLRKDWKRKIKAWKYSWSLGYQIQDWRTQRMDEKAWVNWAGLWCVCMMGWTAAVSVNFKLEMVQIGALMMLTAIWVKTIKAGAARFHDLGWSGKWAWLMGIVGLMGLIGGIAMGLIVILGGIKKGDLNENKYGPCNSIENVVFEIRNQKITWILALISAWIIIV